MDCRFLYVVGQLGAGGSEHQLYLLLKAMNRKQYRPGVFVWSFSEADVYASRIRALGVPIYSLLRSTLPVAKLLAIRRLVTQMKPQVVHSYSFYMNFPVWCSTIGTNAIAIGALRSDFQWGRNVNGMLLGRLSARWPPSQIFNSFAAAYQAEGLRSIFAPGRCYVVRNGVDLEQFSALPLPLNGRTHILGVGSLNCVKRWDRLLLAARELKARGLDFVIRIAGDGPLHNHLKEQAGNFGIMDCIELLGYRADVPDLLAGSNFLVHTSDTEGCPNVVMEAMACGRPVIATGVGDVSRLVHDGQTGFVVNPADEKALVERMLTLISNPELCGRMGEAGRAKAAREFGLDRLVSETLAVYEAAGWKNQL